MTQEQPVCAIVGFGPGMGLAVAKAFGKAGYALALLTREPDRHADEVERLRQDGYAVSIKNVDAGDSSALAAALQNAGDIEALIYNASGGVPGMPSVMTQEQLKQSIDINVAGPLAAAQTVLPGMRARGRGSLLFTGGGLALEPQADLACISLGKAAMRSLALSLAQELAPIGIHAATVTICGFIQPGTHFDPDLIAAEYLRLHRQPQERFEPEVIYR